MLSTWGRWPEKSSLRDHFPRIGHSMKMFRLLIPSFLVAFAAGQPSQRAVQSLGVQSLGDGWAIESSSRVTATGEAISSESFKAGDWMKAEVPATVVAAQVKAGVLPDPFFGMNI